MFGRRVKSEVDAVFEKLGVVEDFADLSKDKIYESLLKLPEIDNSDFSVGKGIYTQLNLRFNAEGIDELITNNEAYSKFMNEGKVLAKQNGKTEYLNHNDVYYVENKIYSNEILEKFPTLSLGKRAGKNKVRKMFGVKPIDEMIKAKVIERLEHPINQTFQEYYQKMLPYIYSRRIGKDNKNNDLNRLRRTKICLVSDATVEYSSENETFQGRLSNYELIYTGENAFIKIPSDIKTIDELKQTIDFRLSFAEVITTVFKVESDKEAYMNMLSCKDAGELEKYLKDEDENLVALNKSKEIFGEQIDYKHEFWNTLSLCTGIKESELLDNYSRFLNEDFDYTNPNPDLIIRLFIALNIDVNNYNESAFKTIHLEDYYSRLFSELKSSYRNKYLIYKTVSIINNNGFKDEYESAIKEYDFTEYQFDNSVKVNVSDVFETIFKISISELDNVSDNLGDLLPLLKVREPKDVEKSGDETDKNKHDKHEEEPIDFVELNNEIAENTDDTILEAVTEKPTPRKKTNKAEKRTGISKAYDSSINKKKELNGFIAESKVFNALLKIVSSNGSIEWVSSNGAKAKKCLEGSDSLGYDIKYVVDGVIHYAEVKGTSGKVVEFTLSKNEYEFGDSHKDSYELWFVFIEEDGEAGDPIQLGNIFKFDDNESFFNNSKFSVEQSEFKIRAKIKESE